MWISKQIKRISIVSVILTPELQINTIPLLVTMNRKIKKPPIKLNFQRSQENNK